MQVSFTWPCVNQTWSSDATVHKYPKAARHLYILHWSHPHVPVFRPKLMNEHVVFCEHQLKQLPITITSYLNMFCPLGVIMLTGKTKHKHGKLNTNITARPKLIFMHGTNQIISFFI